MMRPLAALIASFICILGGGILLVPSLGDHAENLLRDREPVAAVRISRDLMDGKPADPGIAYRAAAHEVHMGKVENATEMLEALVNDGRDELEIYRALADLYTSAGRSLDAANLFASRPASELTQAERDRIAGVFRLFGDDHREESYLRVLEENELATEQQRLRLAMRLARSDDASDSLAVFRRLDDDGTVLKDQERLTFFALLLETRAVDEALERSARWTASEARGDLDAQLARLAAAFDVSLGKN